VAEWFKAPVLKTGVPARVPWVRIPPLPPELFEIIDIFGFYGVYAQSGVQTIWDDTDSIGLVVLALVLAIIFATALCSRCRNAQRLLCVFANVEAAEKWFEENDPEGVAFEYEVLE
jgi:hypothetical protein